VFFECRGEQLHVRSPCKDRIGKGTGCRSSSAHTAVPIVSSSNPPYGSMETPQRRTSRPAAPHAQGADPEQLFVASLSACHMLWFVSLASTMKLVVNRYVDNAEGVLEKNSEGRMAMTRVTLRRGRIAAPPSPAGARQIAP